VKAQLLSPRYIGERIVVMQENGLVVGGTLASLSANDQEDGIRLFFKELIDGRGQRLAVSVSYNDEIDV
jgi:hypothetical protein